MAALAVVAVAVVVVVVVLVMVIVFYWFIHSLFFCQSVCICPLCRSLCHPLPPPPPPTHTHIFSHTHTYPCAHACTHAHTLLPYPQPRQHPSLTHNLRGLVDGEEDAVEAAEDVVGGARRVLSVGVAAGRDVQRLRRPQRRGEGAQQQGGGY